MLNNFNQINFYNFKSNNKIINEKNQNEKTHFEKMPKESKKFIENNILHSNHQKKKENFSSFFVNENFVENENNYNNKNNFFNSQKNVDENLFHEIHKIWKMNKILLISENNYKNMFDTLKIIKKIFFLSEHLPKEINKLFIFQQIKFIENKLNFDSNFVEKFEFS